jgi:hypothetical protein
MKSYAIGAYGCGNHGDELIFLGMKQRWPDLIRVISYDKVAKDNEYTVGKMYGQLKRGDRVIFGGGFILRDDYSISLISKMANECLDLGAIVEVRGADIGRNLSSKELVLLSRLFLKCDILEFRSIYGVGLAQILVGDLKKVGFRKDYSLRVPSGNFSVESILPNQNDSNKKLLGLILSLYGKYYIDIIADALWSTERSDSSIQVICLPHCQHTFDEVDKDFLYINKFCNTYLDEAFTIDWTLLTPIKLKSIYTILDGIITTRLHPFYFAIENLIPVLALKFDRIEDAYSLIPLLSPEYDTQNAVLVDEFTSENIQDFVGRL